MPENWIDVSSHNGVIDWKKVRASGIVGAIIRAGYGNDASQQDTAFIANITGTIAAEAEKVRNYRDNLLNTCDTVYCNAEKWAAMTENKQKAWTAYKDALRDVPEQDGFPYTVNWPVMPAEGGTT